MSSKLGVLDVAQQKDMLYLCAVLIVAIPVEWEVLSIPECALWSRSTCPLHRTLGQMLTGFHLQHVCHDGELRHQRWKHKHGPGPCSHSQWDSPGNKIWWTVSNFLLRRAKCNHSARCSDVRSSVVLYCTYLVCVRSGNPTKWLCCTTARDTSPNHKHGQMTAWK